MILCKSTLSGYVPYSEAIAQCLSAIDELRASFSNMQVEEAASSTNHRATQSLDTRASVSPPDYEAFFQKFAELLNVSRSFL